MNRTIFFAIGVVILDAMGIGLLMPVLPDILAEIQGIDPTSLQQTEEVNPIGEIAGIGRGRALEMARAARALGRAGAAGAFVDACEEAARAA